MKATVEKVARLSLVLALAAIFGRQSASAQSTAKPSPVLYFSDLTDGPVSGWEMSTTKGAAVSVWGNNFGAMRGSSRVTVCGVVLNADTDFAEWAASGLEASPPVARGMQRTTFWLKSSMTLGDGTISVTTPEGTSNTLPFHCRALKSNKIYFVDKSGSDAADGLTTSTPLVTVSRVRSLLVAGDIAYFRNGIWSENSAPLSASDTSAFMFQYDNHRNGNADNSITVASYPGEVAQLGVKTQGTSVKVHVNETVLNYWTFSKFSYRALMNWVFSSGSVGTSRMDHVRVVGGDFSTPYHEGSLGNHPIQVGGMAGNTNMKFLGNYIHDAGTDFRGQNPYRKVYAVYVSGYGYIDNMEWGWNEICWNVRGRALDFYGHTARDRVDNLYVHDNYLHHNGENGVILNGGDSTNLDCAPLIDAAGLCAASNIRCQDTPSKSCCNYQNYFSLCKYEFINNLYFYNNIMWSNGIPPSWVDPGQDSCGFNLKLDVMASAGGYGGKFYIYNNTFYNNAMDFFIFSSESYLPKRLEVKNNIFFHDNSYPYGFQTKVVCSTCVGEKNLFFSTASASIPPWFSGSIVDKDPQMVGRPPQTVFEFALRPLSPAIKSGTSLAPIVEKDFIGNARPADGTSSLGAFEWRNVTAPSSPHLNP